MSFDGDTNLVDELFDTFDLFESSPVVYDNENNEPKNCQHEENGDTNCHPSTHPNNRQIQSKMTVSTTDPPNHSKNLAHKSLMQSSSKNVNSPGKIKGPVRLASTSRNNNNNTTTTAQLRTQSSQTCHSTGPNMIAGSSHPPSNNNNNNNSTPQHSMNANTPNSKTIPSHRLIHNDIPHNNIPPPPPYQPSKQWISPTSTTMTKPLHNVINSNIRHLSSQPIIPPNQRTNSATKLHSATGSSIQQSLAPSSTNTNTTHKDTMRIMHHSVTNNTTQQKTMEQQSRNNVNTTITEKMTGPTHTNDDDNCCTNNSVKNDDRPSGKDNHKNQEASPMKIVPTNGKKDCNRFIIELSLVEEDSVVSISSMDTEQIELTKEKSNNLVIQNEDVVSKNNSNEKLSENHPLVGMDIICPNDNTNKSLVNVPSLTYHKDCNKDFACSNTPSTDLNSESDFTNSHTMQQLMQISFEKKRISPTKPKNNENHSKRNPTVEERKKRKNGNNNRRKRNNVKTKTKNIPTQGAGNESTNGYNYISNEALTVLRYILSKDDRAGKYSMLGEELKELAWLWEITEMLGLSATKEDCNDKSDNWDYVRQHGSINLNRFLSSKEINRCDKASDLIHSRQERIFEEFKTFLQDILESRKRRVLRRYAIKL